MKKITFEKIEMNTTDLFTLDSLFTLINQALSTPEDYGTHSLSIGHAALMHHMYSVIEVFMDILERHHSLPISLKKTRSILERTKRILDMYIVPRKYYKMLRELNEKFKNKKA